MPQIRLDHMGKSLLTIVATGVSFVAFAQEGNGVGYPNVAAALDALKARSDVEISVQGGWTIVDERAANTMWSFTPSDHPAHPTVVKRAVVSHDGAVSIDMTALCQSSKVACDKLMDEFKQLNERMSEAMKEPPAEPQKHADGTWQPAPGQVKLIEVQTQAYFATRDAGRYKEAYDMFSATFQKIAPFERWSSEKANFNSRMGKSLRRDIKKITWYRNPPQVAPGTYAAVDFSSQFTNANIHCGFVVWADQGDGTFRIVREEENIIDKVTEQKLEPDDLARARAQLGCRE